MSKDLLRIQPVGGVGQIGSNMTLFQTKEARVLVDAGILFPSEDFFDINYLIPDLSELIENPPTDIIITHGHEDHIGAIRHIIEAFPEINIFAPKFAALLIRRKLDYLKVSKKIEIYDTNSVITISDIEVHPIHVNHSIPDTFGLVIKDVKDQFSTFLVSDFKIDEINPYERLFDFKKLKEVTKNSTQRILLADSTNILSKNVETPSESIVLESMKELLSRGHNRVYITCFSSNVHRIQSIIEAAKLSNKRVLLYGRSMINYAQTAEECSIIENGSYYIDQASLPNKDNLVVILSGCQGDFRGSFRRFAKGEDTHFKPQIGDLLIMSSKSIPGNEKKLSLLENELTESGVEIITPRTHHVHVSGHPGKKDLLRLYKEYSPDYIVPIHGESLFIKEHCDYINESYQQAKAVHIHNFDNLVLTKELELKLEKGEVLDPVLIHGKGIEIERTHISKRRKFANTGAIFVSVNKESLTKRKILIDLSIIGLPDSFQDKSEELEELITSELSGRKIKLLEKTAEELRIVIRRVANLSLGYKPVTIVHFV